MYAAGHEQKNKNIKTKTWGTPTQRKMRTFGNRINSKCGPRRELSGSCACREMVIGTHSL